MKTRRKSRAAIQVEIPEETIQVVCELFRVPVTAKGAKVFEAKIREAIREVYPGAAVRGLWVHKGIGKGSS